VPIKGLTDNWTHDAASRHTIAPKQLEGSAHLVVESGAGNRNSKKILAGKEVHYKYQAIKLVPIIIAGKLKSIIQTPMSCFFCECEQSADLSLCILFIHHFTIIILRGQLKCATYNA